MSDSVKNWKKRWTKHSSPSFGHRQRNSNITKHFPSFLSEDDMLKRLHDQQEKRFVQWQHNTAANSISPESKQFHKLRSSLSRCMFCTETYLGLLCFSTFVLEDNMASEIRLPYNGYAKCTSNINFIVKSTTFTKAFLSSRVHGSVCIYQKFICSL